MALDDSAAVHLDHGAAVGEGVGVEGFDDGKFVGVLGEMGEAVGDPQAGLAVLSEGAFGGEEGFGLDGAAADFQIDGFAIAFLQFRFVVK